MPGPDDGSSPWENGDIPVRDAPLQITWDAPEPSRGVDSDDSPSPASTRRWAIGSVAAALLLVVGVVAWPRGDDGDDADATTPVTLDSLPSVSDPADGREEDRPNDDDDGSADPSGADADVASAAVDGELPPTVAAITTPTEIVVQSTDGLIHTVSLPSGTIRTVDLGTDGSFGGGSDLVVSDDATMISAYDQGTFIVPREGVPLRLDDAPFDEVDEFGNLQANPYGYVTGPDGTPSFLVAMYEPATNGRTDFLVDVDGLVTPVVDDAASEFSEPVRAYGVRIVNDAGGVYRLGDGGAERISEGRVVGSSSTELLVRECDELLDCTLWIVGFDGQGRLEVDLPPGLDRTYGLELSPDATAVTFISYGTRIEQVIIGFDGTSSSTPVAGFGGAAWASDGSGVFALAPQGGLLFVDRATGESAVFAEELGALTALDIRFPDAELDATPSVSEDVVGLSSAPAGAIGLDLAVLSDLGAMSILDLDSLTSSSWTAPRITGNKSPRIFDLGDRLVVLAGAGNSGFSTTPGAATPIDDDLLPEPPFARDPDGIGIWTRAPDVLPAIAQVVDPLRVMDTGFKPRTVTAPDGDVLGDDGAGSLVIESSGDIYAADGSDLTRLTSGDLLAVSATAAAVRECDEVLMCNEFVVDRRSGEQSPLTDTLAVVAVAADAERDVSLVGSLSPDGTTMMIEVSFFDVDGDPGIGWLFLDLVGDIQTRIETPNEGQPIIWNDDGSYAAFLADGQLSLYEASTRTIIDVELASDARALGRVDGALASL